MRPVKIGPLTPSDTSTVWFNPASLTSTGAAVAPLQTSTLDNLAHRITLALSSSLLLKLYSLAQLWAVLY